MSSLPMGQCLAADGPSRLGQWLHVACCQRHLLSAISNCLEEVLLIEELEEIADVLDHHHALAMPICSWIIAST